MVVDGQRRVDGSADGDGAGGGAALRPPCRTRRTPGTARPTSASGRRTTGTRPSSWLTHLRPRFALSAAVPQRRMRSVVNQRRQPHVFWDTGLRRRLGEGRPRGSTKLSPSVRPRIRSCGLWPGGGDLSQLTNRLRPRRRPPNGSSGDTDVRNARATAAAAAAPRQLKLLLEEAPEDGRGTDHAAPRAGRYVYDCSRSESDVRR